MVRARRFDRVGVYLQLFNAFLPDLIAYLDFGKSRQSMAKHARRRTWPSGRWNHEFILAEKYAATLKTVALAVIYDSADFLPHRFLGLCVTYCSDKYIALRARKPVRMKTMHSLYVVMSMQVLALTQLSSRSTCGSVRRKSGRLVHRRAHHLDLVDSVPPTHQSLHRHRARRGVRRRRHRGVSTNMGKGAGANARRRCRPGRGGRRVGAEQAGEARKVDLLGIKLEDFDKGRLDMYHPPLPADASEGTIKNLVAEYRLFDEPTKGDPTLMRGQKPRTAVQASTPGAMRGPRATCSRGWASEEAVGGRGGWFTPAQQASRRIGCNPNPEPRPRLGRASAAGAVRMMLRRGPPGARVVYVQPPPGAPLRSRGGIRAARCAAAGGIPAPPPGPRRVGCSRLRGR